MRAPLRLRRALTATSFTAVLSAGLAAQEHVPAPLTAVPFDQVRIADAFFAPRQATNRDVTLAHALRQLEETGTLANFDLAAQGRRDGFRGYVFQDSDAYKALEAIAYVLATRPDPALAARFDAVVARLARAQQADGYLNSWYAVHGKARFTNLRDDHELYCAGHLFEAAAAHWQATGKRNLLDVATRYADLLAVTFGQGGDRRPGYCGHPEVELALVKLGAATGERRYADLARAFIDARGGGFFAVEHGTNAAEYDGTYWVDHAPVRELRSLAGHAVRAAYLMAGAADVAAGDEALQRALRRAWRNTVERNAFVTGGIGPSARNEGFTVDFDLPTESAYQETCASIALAMWSHRMNLLFGDARYADAVETTLYNAVLAGVQLDGTRFFYVNPLASRGAHHRSEWFGCACCPPNVARTIAALGGYAYATSADGLWVNLYVQGELRDDGGDADAASLAIDVATDYPWDGRVLLTLRAPLGGALRLRRPGWCAHATVAVNGERVEPPLDNGYLVVERQWREGDVVELNMDMPVRRLEADPRAQALRGMCAFARGPIVYCFEQCDHEVPLERLCLAPDAALTPERRLELLGGVVVLRGEGIDAGDREWPGGLYRALPAPRRVPVLAVPYCTWDNRAGGAMQVWLPSGPRPAEIVGPERRARLEVSFRNSNADPEGIRDGGEPKASGEQPARLCHWWNHKGGTEWVQYSWAQPRAVGGVRVYWFDDTGRGECRLPKAVRVLYRVGEGGGDGDGSEGGAWKPLLGAGGASLPIALDRWCELRCVPVTACALRLEVDMQEGFAAGVHEWQVLEPEDDG